jgi:hypothetical protein
VTPENPFTLAYYGSILAKAKEAGYTFTTLRQHWDEECPREKRFILRHDVDTNPMTLKGVLDAEAVHDVPSTVFVRVTGNTYNPFDYRTYPLFNRVLKQKGELGLHSNFVEFARINGVENAEEIISVLMSEAVALASFYPISGLACHRDLNFTHNSLPWLEEHWDQVSRAIGFAYQAYDKELMDSFIYVNEKTEPHMGWRSYTPEDAIATGRSICMSTHPHWWFKDHPFEI